MAIEKDMKVFLYFKKGFSTDDLEEYENYKQVLEFRKWIEKGNKTLFKDYETIHQFARFIREDMELF